MRLIAGTDVDALDAAVSALQHADEITEGLLSEPVRRASIARDVLEDDSEGSYEDNLRNAMHHVEGAKLETEEWLEFAATMHVVGRWRTSNETYEAVTDACKAAIGHLDDWHDWASAELRDLD